MKKLLIAMSLMLLCSCNADNGQREISQRLKNLKRSSVMPVAFRNVDKPDNESYIPMNYEVQKGIWISYIDLDAMLRDADEAEFRNGFKNACRQVKELGFNTVYVHVRPFGDALYASKLYPRSVMTDGSFDPLKIMVEQAHEAQLSFHAWINPLRLQTPEDLQKLDNSFLTKQWYSNDNDMVKAVDGSGQLWLDPAYPEVRQLIAQGAGEIVKNYDVDAIHYDDYFYPTTDEAFDAACYSNSGSSLSLDNWRLENISMMCSEIYSAVKAENSNVLVEISPQGNMDNNYAYMYADVKKWCSEKGYCDIIIPQIYFGYENPVKPFVPTLEEWKSIMGDEVKLVIGLGEYKIGQEDEFTLNEGIVASQAQEVFEDSSLSGAAVYSYGSLFTPSSETQARTEAEIKAISTILHDQEDNLIKP